MPQNALNVGAAVGGTASFAFQACEASEERCPAITFLLFLPPNKKGERQGATSVLPFARSFQERNHPSRCIVKKNLAIILRFRFILGMLIRTQNADSKLFAVRPRRVAISCKWHAIATQLGKDGGYPLPLHPSPVPPMAATETLPVSIPSRGPSAGRRGSWIEFP